jgi:hypothetical protein
MTRRRRERGPAAAAAPRPFPWSWALFLGALALRLLYWRATADSAWPHTAAFKGDALLWLEYARALREGGRFELGLPIHPPGTAYLVAALWTGSGGFGLLKVVWCVLGAAAVALSAAAITRVFGVTVGVIAGVWMAGSSSLLMLSASLNGETPYVALVAAGFWLLPGAEDVPPARRVAVWAALQALACLFRVEHLLFVCLAITFMAVRALRRDSPRAAAVLAGVAAAAFLLPLVPWHMSAWRAIARFNDVPPVTPPAVRRVLDELRGVAWDPEARARLDALPAFARDQSEAFVAATVAHRGGARVRETDLGVLREAFGVEVPRLRPRPFISLYGPLNFALASHPDAAAGFGHAALDVPPPLTGGAGAYPAMLISGLPPREVSLTYPPHASLVSDGYAMGWRWLAADPERALRRGLTRLARFWAGAATTLTGYGLPIGLSGTRYAVDITVPGGGIAAAWRIVVFALSVAGLAMVWRRAAVYPWLFLFVTKAAAAAAFFGYARLGATTIPVVALLVALALERFGPTGSDARRRRAAAIALALMVTVEAGRCLHRPGLALDGFPAGPQDPVPHADHLDHELVITLGSTAR